MDYPNELQETIFGAQPGTRQVLTIERDGARRELRPTLTSWPTYTY